MYHIWREQHFPDHLLDLAQSTPLTPFSQWHKMHEPQPRHIAHTLIPLPSGVTWLDMMIRQGHTTVFKMWISIGKALWIPQIFPKFRRLCLQHISNLYHEFFVDIQIWGLIKRSSCCHNMETFFALLAIWGNQPQHKCKEHITDQITHTVKPVYNDHLMGYFSAFCRLEAGPAQLGTGMG